MKAQNTRTGAPVGQAELNTKKHRKGFFKSLRTYFVRDRLGELLVTKGLIEPAELKTALKLQKQTSLPLGQIFIKRGLISRAQLQLILGRQMALRLAAAFVLCLFAVTNTSGKKARADMIKDVPARIALAAAPDMSGAFTKVSAHRPLFESHEKRSSDLKPFTKWTSMFKRFDQELNRPSSDETIKNWKQELETLRGLSLHKTADKVNRLVNDVRYIGDSKNWGQSDYWATPVEFFQRGGDCEDFAIAKYTALRMLGVPENRMRIAIVHDNLKNIPHAVLAVYTDEGTVILDNQNDHLVNGDRLDRYRPIFSINRTAWWLHTAPTSSPATVVASAN